MEVSVPIARTVVSTAEGKASSTQTMELPYSISGDVGGRIGK